MVFFFFTGNIFLYIDQSSKINIHPFIKGVFLANHFKLSFGEKEKAKLYDEFLLDVERDESKLLTLKNDDTEDINDFNSINK